MSKVSSLLEAGALLPAGTKIDPQEPVDPISARRYLHPALGDRPVVRLSADGLAQGDDLVMEFLGFEKPAVNGPLAYRRRQSLGFPGWALIHDPGHARYALEVVKEFKKEARRAKSKPGHAYDGFTAIARQLGRSVANFLPSYWEQVGREFIQIGNNTYGSRAFNKAREAERVHALKVDENLRRDAFLEFALAGCLTNQALTEYGAELQQSHKPEDAWRFFREVCVRRTLGGMPPWATMSKDLKSLITAAKLDVEQETLALLEEIAEAPSMSRASMAFWKAYRKEFKTLAARSDRVAGALLNLVPQGDWQGTVIWTWLDFLEAWDVLPNLWKQDVAEAARPRGAYLASCSSEHSICSPPWLPRCAVRASRSSSRPTAGANPTTSTCLTWLWN